MLVRLRSLSAPNRLVSFFALAFASLLVTGCTTIGPDYQPPSVGVGQDWSQTLPPGVSAAPIDPAALATWWTQFDDPVLNSLIDRAAAGNLDLKTADTRLRAARASREIATSRRFPTIGLGGDALQNRTQAYTQGDTISYSYYDAGFDASWEIDLFGRVSRQIEQADALVEQTEALRRDVLVRLLSEVAINYVEVRSFQERLRVARGNEAAQVQSQHLLQLSFDAGEVARLDLEQATLNLETTRSQIPLLSSGLAQSQNRLAALLGEQPGTLSDTLDTPRAIPTPSPEIAVGIPAAALRRRPDVRAAERALAAQTAAIGAAEANLYPTLSMNGSIGVEALDAGDIFQDTTEAYAIGPSLSWMIFDAGAIRANIEVQSAQQEAALYAYEGAVLTALNDVENSLIAYREQQTRRVSLRAAETAARRTLDLAEQRYRAGESGYLIVLDAQRSLLTLQDQVASNRAAITTSAISLFKALGGGWSTLEPKTAGAAAALTER